MEGNSYRPAGPARLLECVARGPRPRHGARRRAAAAPQQIGQCDTCSAPNSVDLMIHVAEERGPMKLIRGLLFGDRGPPVELLYDSPVAQHQCAVPKLRRQTNNERAEHVAASRCVLVGREMAAVGIDVHGVQLSRDGIRVVWHELALYFLQDAGRFGVEALDGKAAPLRLELQSVAYDLIVAGLFPIAERCRPATVKQRLQLLHLLICICRSHDLKPGLIPKDKGHRLVRNICSFTRKWGRHSMDCQPQVLHGRLSFPAHDLRFPGHRCGLMLKKADLSQRNALWQQGFAFDD